MVKVFYYFTVIFLAFLPAFVWLWFFLKSDPHPEPKSKIFYTFFWGFLSTIPAFIIEFFLQKLNFFKFTLIFVLLIGVVEELTKFLVVVRANKNNKYFDEPVDAMIYMIVAALGFASMENLLVVLREMPQFSFFSFFNTINTVALRFIGATLLHSLSSAVVGYYWALGHFKKKDLAIVKGMFLAIIIHALFNFIILNYVNPSFYSIFFLVAIAFFVLMDFDKLKKDNK